MKNAINAVVETTTWDVTHLGRFKFIVILISLHTFVILCVIHIPGRQASSTAFVYLRIFLPVVKAHQCGNGALQGTISFCWEQTLGAKEKSKGSHMQWKELKGKQEKHQQEQTGTTTFILIADQNGHSMKVRQSKYLSGDTFLFCIHMVLGMDIERSAAFQG